MLLLLYVPQAYDIVRGQDMARDQFPSLPYGSLYFMKKNYIFELFSWEFSLNFPKLKKCFQFLNLPFRFLVPILASITDYYSVTIF